MMQAHRAFAVSALVALLSGCGGSPPTQYYTLDPVRPALTSPGSADNAPVQVVAVHIPAALDRQEMVAESAPNHLVVSDQNRWGAPLGDMARRTLTQDLAQRLPTRRVILPDEPAPPQTDDVVVDILEFDSGPSGLVTLDGSWSLLRDGSETPLIDRTVHLTARATPGDFAAQAHAMSEILGQLSDQIAEGLASLPRRAVGRNT